MEILKQPQYAPVPVEEQVLVIYAVSRGHFDQIGVADIARAENELRDFVRVRHSHVLEGIRRTGSLPDGDDLDVAIVAFTEAFGEGE